MPKPTALTLAVLAILGGAALAKAQPAQSPPPPAASPPVPMPGMKMPPPGGPAGGMPMMGMMQGSRMQDRAGMGMMPADHIEGRIAFLKAELKITDAQSPQWNAFADALRGNANDMRTAVAAAMQSGATQADMAGSTMAGMDRMIQMMSARLDAMKAVQAAAKPLYAVLSDDQKKMADELLIHYALPMPARGMRM